MLHTTSHELEYNYRASVQVQAQDLPKTKVLEYWEMCLKVRDGYENKFPKVICLLYLCFPMLWAMNDGSMVMCTEIDVDL